MSDHRPCGPRSMKTTRTSGPRNIDGISAPPPGYLQTEIFGLGVQEDLQECIFKTKNSTYETTTFSYHSANSIVQA